MPQVSVIIPAYNAEKTILATINSVLNQTYEDFELIVVDDGSTDKTVELVKTISDPRMKVFSYPNGGTSVARNRGIEQASGDYLSFIDHDDMWVDDKLESQLAIFREQPDIGAVYSWTIHMQDYKESISLHPSSKSTIEGDVYLELLMYNFTESGSNILIRREVIDEIGGFTPNLDTSDWEFCLRVAAKFKFGVSPRYHILYRRVIGSMSYNLHRMEEATIQVWERAFTMDSPELDSLSSIELQDFKKKSLAIIYRYLASIALSKNVGVNDLPYAQEKLWLAFRLYPKIFQESWSYRLIIKWLKLYIENAIPTRIRLWLEGQISTQLPTLKIPQDLRVEIGGKLDSLL